MATTGTTGDATTTTTEDSGGSASADVDTGGPGSTGVATDPESSGGTGLASEDASESTGTEVFVPARNAIENLLHARCEWLFNCCSTGELAVSVGPFTTDAVDCSARVTAALEHGTRLAPVEAGPSDDFVLLSTSHAAGRIELREAVVDECAASLRTAACTPTADDPTARHCTPGSSAMACDIAQMAIGRVAEGEPCDPELGVECTAGLVCHALGSNAICLPGSSPGDYCFSDLDCTTPHYCEISTGTCQRASGEGEPCSIASTSEGAQPCQSGLVCDVENMICMSQCARGTPCTEASECPEGLVCVLGRCGEVKPAGEPCEFGADCESGFCDSGTCAVAVADGEPCRVHAQCTSGFCHPFGEQCAARQADGEPCDSFSDLQCDGGVCDSSDPLSPVCVIPGAEGEPCTIDADCDVRASLACISTFCTRVPLPNDAPCVSSTQCESGLCWESLCAVPTPTGGACVPVPDGLTKPCSVEAFCAPNEEGTSGTCTMRKGPGEPCRESLECWGSCRLLWGRLLCDGTLPTGEAWCDGEP